MTGSHTGTATIGSESNADSPSPIAAVLPAGNANLGQAQQPQQHSIFDLFPSLSGHWDKSNTHQKVVEEMERGIDREFVMVTVLQDQVVIRRQAEMGQNRLLNHH